MKSEKTIPSNKRECGEGYKNIRRDIVKVRMGGVLAVSAFYPTLSCEKQRFAILGSHFQLCEIPPVHIMHCSIATL